VSEQVDEIRALGEAYERARQRYLAIQHTNVANLSLDDRIALGGTAAVVEFEMIQAKRKLDEAMARRTP